MNKNTLTCFKAYDILGRIGICLDIDEDVVYRPRLSRGPASGSVVDCRGV